MIKWTLLIGGGMLSACVSGAETIQLSQQASITGRILAEKAQHLVVDIGYTVLLIPRDHVVKVERPEEASPEDEVPPAVSEVLALFRSGDVSVPEKTVRELVLELGESVVQVRTPSGLGSGFLVNEEGFLITNFHVIEGETQISAEVYHTRNGQLDRRNYKRVRIVAMNRFADLALLKIEDENAPKFKPVVLGSADALAVGESVFAIGSPLGLERTVTEGILSTKTREMQGELYLQTTTQINPGNSGGPLFNMRGQVVGVTNMKMTFTEGLGFAIPVETVKFFLNHRDAYAYDTENPNNAYRYLPPPTRIREAAIESKH